MSLGKNKSIMIINGPNLNLLGRREPEIYGSKSFEQYFKELQGRFGSVNLTYFQSNHEGEILDVLHKVDEEYDAVIINAGAYTHTSIAIADAISGIVSDVYEVHISNVYERELFRQDSYLTKPCVETIVGYGLIGYDMAIKAIISGTIVRAVSILITGKVQGVWFRYRSKQKADSLKISGNVRNMPDGSVTIKANGSKHNIDTFIKYLHRGPEHANVTKVVVTDVKEKIAGGFVIVR